MNMISKSPAPTITQNMVLRAARWLVNRHAMLVPDLEQAAQDIAQVYSNGLDGYALARALENTKGWKAISTSTVNDLDALEAVVQQELTMARRRWVRDNDIRPPFPDGEHLAQGQIVSVYEFAPATYRVKERGCTAQGRHLLVKFEDAIPIAQNVVQAWLGQPAGAAATAGATA